MILASGMSVLVMTHQMHTLRSNHSLYVCVRDLPHSRSVDEELHVDMHHALPVPRPLSLGSCKITQTCQTTIRAGFKKFMSRIVFV